jgi:hypothetical protein
MYQNSLLKFWGRTWLTVSHQWSCLFIYWTLYSAFGKLLCTYKRCWKWRPWASIQAWTHLTLFANTFWRSDFGKSLCTYKRCWKWRSQASIQAWTNLTLFAYTFWRFTFLKSLGTYKTCWKWCPWASIHAWTHLILFATTFCRSMFRKSLRTYKRCWKWCQRWLRYWRPNLHTTAQAHSDLPNALYLSADLPPEYSNFYLTFRTNTK